MPDTPYIDVRRAGERMVTRTSWLDSNHCFSFGPHYDPGNTHYGVLLVSNDDTLSPGQGFDTHPHRDMEIVTWVLRGSLVHQDSLGHSGVIYPGLAQRMSAGTGILHSERNDSWRVGAGPQHTEPVHFIQMWVVPDEPGRTPGYQQREIDVDLAGGGLLPVASGMDSHRDDAAIIIGNRHATLHVARTPDAGSVHLPTAPYLHLFVAHGAVELEGFGALSTGDAARLRRSGGQRLTAVGDAEILVWEMHADLTSL